MIYGFFLFIHIIVSILMVVAVLMQASKGGGMAGIAGTGMGGSTSFGGRSAATLLHKVTIGLAVTFAVNCLLLSVLSKGRSAQVSVVQEAGPEETFPLDFIPDAANNVMMDENSDVSGTGGATELPPAEENNTEGE